VTVSSLADATPYTAWVQPDVVGYSGTTWTTNTNMISATSSNAASILSSK
jgi:hypothetical protein